MGFVDSCAQTKTDVKTLTISGENVQQGPRVSDYIKGYLGTVLQHG